MSGARYTTYFHISAVLVLYHPEASQNSQNSNLSNTIQPSGSPVHAFAHDYYMFTSYVMPAAQLVVSDFPDRLEGYYDVTFKVCVCVCVCVHVRV